MHNLLHSFIEHESTLAYHLSPIEDIEQREQVLESHTANSVQQKGENCRYIFLFAHRGFDMEQLGAVAVSGSVACKNAKFINY